MDKLKQDIQNRINELNKGMNESIKWRNETANKYIHENGIRQVDFDAMPEDDRLQYGVACSEIKSAQVGIEELKWILKRLGEK